MEDFITPIMRWSSRALAWAMRARLVIFTASVIALALLAPLLYVQTEPSVRISGLVLQLLGISAAAVGIRDTRRMFGKPSFLQLVRTWFKSIPGLRPHVASASCSSSLSLTSSAKGYAWRGPGSEPTIESRLAAAEQNLAGLRSRVDQADSELDTHVRASEQNLRNERDSRVEGDRQLHLKIEAASTDGLHLAALGAAWLAVGVVMSTIPNELLALVR